MLVVQVTLTGGAEHPAKIVGYDEDRDVAVLQLITTEGEPVSPQRAATPALVVSCCHKRRRNLEKVFGYMPQSGRSVV